MFINDINQLKYADFAAGITFLVDKPIGWTSFDVVNKLKYLIRNHIGLKKFKIGHSGTLDPLATGLLLIAVGKDTKTLNEYQNLDKVYTGSMKIGASTMSYDAEFEPDSFYETEHIDENLLYSTLKIFTGKIEQKPPIFSAVKVGGKAAYKKARAGESVELKTREVEIFEFKLLNIDLDDLKFMVHCQKGTYIRSLIHDFGKYMDSGAYLTSLRREKIGEFEIKDAFDLEELIRFFQKL